MQNLFEGTQYESRVDEIQNMIEGKDKSARIIYLSSLHLFGRKGGLEIYNKVKAANPVVSAAKYDKIKKRNDGL